MWNDLTMSQRAEVIQMAVKNGIKDLNQIRSFYDDALGSRKDYVNNSYDNIRIFPRKYALGGPKSRIQALQASRKATSPNTDFSKAMDVPWYSGLAATYAPKLFGMNPHTCLNTVTGFYDSYNTVASNANLWANPQDYGYEQIPQTEAKPGDIIILSDKDNYPRHAVMFDKVATENSEKYGYPIMKGDTLVNYSNGGRGKDDYRLQATLKRFDNPISSGGDFSGERRYFKYVGKSKGAFR